MIRDPSLMFNWRPPPRQNDKFSLDALVNMLACAGMRVEVKVSKAA